MRFARASLPSLIAISAAFFLPFVRGCQTMESGMSMVRAEGLRLLPALWIVPRFAVAALLFALTVSALGRGRAPGRVSSILAGLGLLTMLPAAYFDGDEVLRRLCHLDRFHLGLAATVFGLGALALVWAVAAWRRQGWERWERLVAAYAALASPFICFVAKAFFDSWRDVGVGGYAYATGIVTLLTLRALSAHAANCRTSIV
jgi:hypothetical protein